MAERTLTSRWLPVGRARARSRPRHRAGGRGPFAGPRGAALRGFPVAAAGREPASVSAEQWAGGSNPGASVAQAVAASTITILEQRGGGGCESCGGRVTRGGRDDHGKAPEDGSSASVVIKAERVGAAGTCPPDSPEAAQVSGFGTRQGLRRLGSPDNCAAPP